MSQERHGRGQNLNPGFTLADGNPKSPPPWVSLPGSLTAVTFVGSLESQGAAAAVALEEEPHLMMGADDEVWDRGTCQAVGREMLRGLHPAKSQGKPEGNQGARPTLGLSRSKSEARPHAQGRDISWPFAGLLC